MDCLPVFATGGCCDILVAALCYAQAHQSLQVYAWVILDNHFHAILGSPELSRTLASIKSYTAKLLLTQIEREKHDWLLNQLEYYRAKHKRESRHQIWQERFTRRNYPRTRPCWKRSTIFITIR